MIVPQRPRQCADRQRLVAPELALPTRQQGRAVAGVLAQLSEELDHGAPGDVAGRAIAPPGQHIRLEGLPHLLRALALTLDVSRQPFVIELADGAGLVSL